MTFLSSIAVPFVHPYFYHFGIVTQPWHNITYIGMRAFALITIFAINDALIRYKDSFSMINWLLIVIPLTIATTIKASFTIAFSCALLVLLVYDAIQERFSKNIIISCIKMGTVVFPSIIVMYIQSTILYGDNSSGILISIIQSRFFSTGLHIVVLRLLCNLTLPAIVFIYHFRKGDIKKIEIFITVQFAIGLTEVILLQETGKRAGHGNFLWTMYIVGYLLFMWVFGRILSDIKKLTEEVQRGGVIKGNNMLYILTCGILSTLHIISGIVYFASLSCGGDYKI